jgi:hypothetical protein
MTSFQLKEATIHALKEGYRMLFALLVSTAITFVFNYLIEVVVPTLGLSPEVQGIVILGLATLYKSYDRGVHEAESIEANGIIPSP